MAPSNGLLLFVTSISTFEITRALVSHPRRSVPDVLPEPWISKGCYTDVSTSRTLAAASYTSASAMDVESCLAFCINGGYHYAGVEYGKECFCDSIIQSSGVPTSIDECNMTCSGSPLESCGAGNRINVYHDGAADPTIVKKLSSWAYQGCYTDDVNSRTLPERVDISAELTPAKCTATCKSGGFAYSGLEYASECWCGQMLPGSSNQAPAADCQMICAGDSTKFCGGSDRLILYHDDLTEPSDPQTCQKTLNTNFNLQAVYKYIPNPPTPVKVVDVNAVPHVGYAILSGCTACGSAWSFNTLKDGGLLPKSSSNPYLTTVSFSLIEGESPSFISTQFPPPPYSGYCLVGNSIEPGGRLVLAANGRFDIWALCPNSTANGRIDVVYGPKENHPHYIKANCKEVYLEQI